MSHPVRMSHFVSPAQRNVSLDQPKTIRSYGMEVQLQQVELQHDANDPLVWDGSAFVGVRFYGWMLL